MLGIIERLLSNPYFVYMGIIGVSVIALAGAFISQYVFGLEPCILCIYQRYPYAVAIGLGIIGLILANRSPLLSSIPVFLSAIAFGVNAGIAFHHVGVEQHWWTTSAGCDVNFADAASDPSSLLEQMLAKPAVACDEIPWADPFFDISMAGYNTILCACLCVGCLICTALIYKRRSA